MADDIATQVEQLIAQVHQLDEQQPTDPTLVYFDVIGICWPVRCLLHLPPLPAA